MDGHVSRRGNRRLFAAAVPGPRNDRHEQVTSLSDVLADYGRRIGGFVASGPDTEWPTGAPLPGFGRPVPDDGQSPADDDPAPLPSRAPVDDPPDDDDGGQDQV